MWANHPEWLLVTFPRRVAISDFQVYPRTFNGGYGPKDIQLWLNGASVYQGTMSPTATLDVPLSPLAYATNAELYITSSYDPAYPTNSRNVQVVELVFKERAAPGTFADWALHQFTEPQLADPAVSGPLADPDQDGVPNLLEFATGANPLLPDAAAARLQPVATGPTTFGFIFHQRSDLGDVQSRFETSTNLVDWQVAAPMSLVTLSNLPSAQVREAQFSTPNTRSFFRLKFLLP